MVVASPVSDVKQLSFDELIRLVDTEIDDLTRGLERISDPRTRRFLERMLHVLRLLREAMDRAMDSATDAFNYAENCVGW